MPRRQVPLAIVGTLVGVIVGALLAWFLLAPPRSSVPAASSEATGKSAAGSAADYPQSRNGAVSSGNARPATAAPKFTAGPVTTNDAPSSGSVDPNHPPAFTSAVAPNILILSAASATPMPSPSPSPTVRNAEVEEKAPPPARFVSTGNPPQKIDVKSLRTTVDDVVIPVPSEVFKALDKLGTPPWASEVRVDDKTKHSGRPHLSLLFGTVVADGFLAVQAKDADKVKKIGRRVLELATAMGVRANVISHTQSIIEAADRGDWNEVRAELDKTQGEVKSAMEKLQDREESELVSMGGWLRGTEALTDIVRKDYNADRAELLHQPDLLVAFDTQLNKMRPNIKKDQLVAKLQAGLSEIRPLIVGGDRIAASQVERVWAITSELVAAISPASAPSTASRDESVFIPTSAGR